MSGRADLERTHRHSCGLRPRPAIGYSAGMRITILFVLGLLAASIVTEPRVRADDASHRAAVEKLLATLNMEKTHAATLEGILQQQVRANPSLGLIQDTMRDFMNKYMAWSTLKEDVVKLYLETFSEEEVGELNKFYESAAGRKYVEKFPALTARGMALAQERLQAHLPELQAALKAAAEKRTGVPQTNPAGKK